MILQLESVSMWDFILSKLNGLFFFLLITYRMRNVLLKQAEAGSDEVYAQVSLFPENEVSFFFSIFMCCLHSEKILCTK